MAMSAKPLTSNCATWLTFLLGVQQGIDTIESRYMGYSATHHSHSQSMPQSSLSTRRIPISGAHDIQPLRWMYACSCWLRCCSSLGAASA